MKTQIIVDNIRTPITSDDNEILEIAKKKLKKSGKYDRMKWKERMNVIAP